MSKFETKILVGLELKEAETVIVSHGYISRIVHRDGSPKVVTRDYNTNRVNLFIENNLVVKTTVG